MRREGTSSPTVPPPPLPLDTHSEERRGGRQQWKVDKIYEIISWEENGRGLERRVRNGSQGSQGGEVGKGGAEEQVGRGKRGEGVRRVRGRDKIGWWEEERN